jgi:hypothetical protein
MRAIPDSPACRPSYGPPVIGACAHAEIEIQAGSPPDEPDDATAPFGPIVQRGRCGTCGAELERHLRAMGWARWTWRPPL